MDLGSRTFAGEEIAILFIGCVLFCINLARGALSIVPCGKSQLRRICADVRCIWRQRTAPRVEDEHVRRRMDAKIVRDLLFSCWFVLAGVGLASLTIVINVVRHHPRWMTDGQTFSCLAAFAFFTGATTCWKRALLKAPPLLYAMIMVISLVINVQVTSLMGGIVTESATFLFRYVASTRYHRVCEVIFWNMFFFCASVAMVVGSIEDPDGVHIMVAYKAWMVGIVIIVSASAARSANEKLSADVHAEALKDESSGLSTLLDLVCDVVVKLDEDLRIRDNSARFSAMVMLQGKSVEGLRLHDYVPAAEDRETLDRYASELVAVPTSRALHVKLRDSLGNLIPVELFCVQTQTLSRKTHFVGIREFSDFAAAVPECKRFGPPAPRHRRHLRLRAVRPGAEDGSGSGSDSSGSSGTVGMGRSTASTAVTPAMEEGLGDADRGQTSDEAVMLALVRVMEMCALGARRAACCPLHRRVALLRSGLSGIAALPCAHRFGPRGPQRACGMCGLLAADSAATRCFACGAAAAVGRAIQAL